MFKMVAGIGVTLKLDQATINKDIDCSLLG